MEHVYTLFRNMSCHSQIFCVDVSLSLSFYTYIIYVYNMYVMSLQCIFHMRKKTWSESYMFWSLHGIWNVPGHHHPLQSLAASWSPTWDIPTKWWSLWKWENMGPPNSLSIHKMMVYDWILRQHEITIKEYKTIIITIMIMIIIDRLNYQARYHHPDPLPPHQKVAVQRGFWLHRQRSRQILNIQR